MAVITLGSPSFDPITLGEETGSIPSSTVTVVGGADSTAMTGETDPIFSAWDKSTGIIISSSQIAADAADAVPTGLTCSSDGLEIAAGTGQSAYVILTWTAITTTTFDYYNIRYKKSTDTYYSYVSSKINTIKISGLLPNTTYNFGVASVNTQGTQSSFCTNINVTTDLDSTAPATVTGLTATAGIQSVILKWTANSELDLDSYNVYHNTVNNSATSTILANTRSTYFINSKLTGDIIKYYWIKAKDTSGNLSVAYSTGASATPTNVTTDDIVDAAITSLKTDLAAIDPTTGNLGPLVVGTAQIDALAVTEAKIAAGAITAAKTSLAAINSGTGNLAVNAVTTDALMADAVTGVKILNAAIDENKIATGAVLEGHIFTGAITTNKIATDAITADKILAGAITAQKITSYNFVLTSGIFTSNSPTDSISWTECTVVYNGIEYTVTADTCDVEDNHIYWELASPTVFLHSEALPTLTDNGFLVAFNDAGTYKLVWNSTLINGGCIKTGSITASNLAAGTITANEIATNAITADKILAGAITANKFTSYNVIVDGPSTAWSGDSVDTISWTGITVYYEGVTYVITNNNTTDYWIYWEKPNTTFSTSDNLPSLTNNGILVARNVDGVPKLCYGGTEINGNQIQTGSISTGLLTAGCIISEKIGAGEIDSDHIVAGAITASKINVTDLSAISADLGTVTAGNWHIEDDYIYTGAKVTGDGYSAAPGDVTLKSDGGIHAYNFYIDADGETSFKATSPQIDGIYFKTMNIGDWNMDADTFCNVDASSIVDDFTKIRSISVMIRNDANDRYYPLEKVYNTVPAGHVTYIYDNGGVTEIVLTRLVSDFFDSTDFNSATDSPTPGSPAYNRGWITLQFTA